MMNWVGGGLVYFKVLSRHLSEWKSSCDL